jgi:lipopolysaccharide export system permease protein
VTRIDGIVLRRIASRIALTVLIFFGLIVLVESINGGRYHYLQSMGGVQLALLGLVAASAQWLLKGLPLLVLVGTVIGVIDLEARRELTAIKSSGASIWRVIRAPALALLLAGLAVTLGGESLVTSTNRDIQATLPGANSPIATTTGFWLEQKLKNGDPYVVQAEHVVGGTQLQDVTIFMPDGQRQGRIVAPLVRLGDGAWEVPQATQFRAGLPPRSLTNYRIFTSTTAGDLRLKLTSTEDMTFYELAASLSSKVSDPVLRAAVTTRFLRLLSLPALLVGALFIAFAFTSGYRRGTGYGRPVIYAILIGFVVFVITEMADRAGSAGSLDPTFAACGPAFVAIVIGLTVLLYREDGWA